jgi:hypothetical protein
MTTCCTYTCNQGRDCPVRQQRAQQAPNIGGRADFVDTINPNDPRHSRHSRPARLDLREPRLSTPAELHAAAGPEPMLPAGRFLEGLLWAACATVAAAAIGLLLGVLAEPISRSWQLFRALAGASGLG